MSGTRAAALPPRGETPVTQRQPEYLSLLGVREDEVAHMQVIHVLLPLLFQASPAQPPRQSKEMCLCLLHNPPAQPRCLRSMWGGRGGLFLPLLFTEDTAERTLVSCGKGAGYSSV